jgi:hypothetical protein
MSRFLTKEVVRNRIERVDCLMFVFCVILLLSSCIASASLPPPGWRDIDIFASVEGWDIRIVQYYTVLLYLLQRCLQGVLISTPFIFLDFCFYEDAAPLI